jgi:uncharacterized FAD-dependent dehydrogenase
VKILSLDYFQYFLPYYYGSMFLRHKGKFMKYIINNIKLALDDDEASLRVLASKKLDLDIDSIKDFRVLKQSIDARNKQDIQFVYSIEAEVDGLLKASQDILMLKEEQAQDLQKGNAKLKNRPIIVGMGPAGLFAGLTLAQNGYKPLVLERGADVDTRTKMVSEFWQNGSLNSNTNVQFGEGGAGTFSDGKLTTRINDSRISKVLDELVLSGAQPEIKIKAKPHVGTDVLRRVVRNIREKIIKLGGEVRFNSQVTQILFANDGAIRGIKVKDEEILSEVVILATGHSARDVYSFLFDQKVQLQSKPFSIGVRIEHEQGMIDRAQYGKFAGHQKLGAADYQLSYKYGNRTAYTFCMCPGGLVVASASDISEVVTNGMSYSKRDGKNANSAFVVSVGPDDYGSMHPLAGIDFQKKWEKAAFESGGRKYYAPVQTLGDFINKKVGKLGEIQPTYTPGVVPYDLNQCLPKFVCETMVKAVGEFDKKVRGFAYKNALLTGVETRTSAPVRILRDEGYQAIGVKGLYPAGEGAGYAGGIMSAAVDGVKIAEAVIRKYC